MNLKVITNTTDFAAFDELNAGEEYIVFGANDNKVYDYHLNYGGPDFGFWKKVCREENLNIDDIVLEELDEDSITTDQIAAVFEKFGRYSENDLDESKNLFEDINHNIGDDMRDYMVDSESKRN